jgi:hypothetical protein
LGETDYESDCSVELLESLPVGSIYFDTDTMPSEADVYGNDPPSITHQFDGPKLEISQIGSEIKSRFVLKDPREQKEGGSSEDHSISLLKTEDPPDTKFPYRFPSTPPSSITKSHTPCILFFPSLDLAKIHNRKQDNITTGSHISGHLIFRHADQCFLPMICNTTSNLGVFQINVVISHTSINIDSCCQFVATKILNDERVLEGKAVPLADRESDSGTYRSIRSVLFNLGAVFRQSSGNTTNQMNTSILEQKRTEQTLVTVAAQLRGHISLTPVEIRNNYTPSNNTWNPSKFDDSEMLSIFRTTPMPQPPPSVLFPPMRLPLKPSVVPIANFQKGNQLYHSN